MYKGTVYSVGSFVRMKSKPMKVTCYNEGPNKEFPAEYLEERVTHSFLYFAILMFPIIYLYGFF